MKQVTGVFIALIYLAALVSFAEAQTEVKPAHPKFSIDASKCDPKSSNTFYWGLGSEGVNVLGMRAGKCVLQISSEIEGGYSVRECEIDPTSGDINIEEKCTPDKGDYGMRCGVHRSFDLSKCKIIKNGNVFEDMDKWPTPSNK